MVNDNVVSKQNRRFRPCCLHCILYSIMITSAMLKSNICHGDHQLPSSSVTDVYILSVIWWEHPALVTVCVLCGLQCMVFQRTGRQRPRLIWLRFIKSRPITCQHRTLFCLENSTARRWFLKRAVLLAGSQLWRQRLLELNLLQAKVQQTVSKHTLIVMYSKPKFKIHNCYLLKSSVIRRLISSVIR